METFEERDRKRRLESINKLWAQIEKERKEFLALTKIHPPYPKDIVIE